MKKLLATATALLALAAVSAPAASAATEFGDACIANRATGEGGKVTLFGIGSTSSPLPDTAPSAGVITSWRLNLITPPPPEKPIPAIIPQTLKVLRLNPATKIAQVIGESSGLVGSGTNTIPARIPVQPGDHIGVFGEGPITYEGSTGELGTLYCEEGTPGDVVGAFLGNGPVGASVPYEEGNELRVPAVAVIEPDADNDGFGDETQDACPQSATTAAPCPLVTLSTTKQVKKGSVVIVVTTNAPAPVTVTGVVKLGKGKKAKLKGGTKNLTPGVLGKFKLKFTKALKNKLADLSRKKSLRLNVTVSGTNVAGQVTKKKLKVKLKGQAKD